MKSESLARKVVIVCALKEEFAAVQRGLGANCGDRFELVRAGMGPASAKRLATELTSRTSPPHWIVSTGFSGALAPGMNVGDIVLSSEIIDAESGRTFKSATDAITQRVQESLAALKIRVHTGGTVCTNDAVFSSAAKQALGEKSRAIAVDMESCAFAENVHASTTRVIVIRTISDAVSDELPAEVGEFLTESGDVRIGKIIRFILKRPSNIKRLMELKKRSDIAAATLTQVWNILRDVPFE